MNMFSKITATFMLVFTLLFSSFSELSAKVSLNADLAKGSCESPYIVAPLTDIKINGVTVSEYVIVTPDATDDTLYDNAAQTLSNGIYNACEKRLGITEKADENALIITAVLDGAKADEFSITISQGNMYIFGGENTGISRGITAFFNEVILQSKGVLELNDGYEFKKTYSNYTTYESFGAVGDGKTDDFDAIIKTHEYANLNGLTVLAKENAKYYIGGENKTAVIKTDTDWSTARIIIDDRNVASRSSWVFSVPATKSAVTLTQEVSCLKKSDSNIGTELEADSLVVLTDSNVKRYIRYGGNQNSGSNQTDALLVSQNGNISHDSPLIWDFDTVTSAVAFPLDTTTLTICGGKFTTIANNEESLYNYYSRGILIKRSRTVVDGLYHTIENEGETGAPYAGFINISCCVNIEVKNCTLSGHKTYKTIGSGGTTVSMGTYDLSVSTAINVRFLNCNQTNDITDNDYWGIFGSNYCKNLVYDGCALSRFDAHQGVVNVQILNSVLGHHGIQLIGSGTALIENTTVLSTNFVSLRSDYGSTWNGEMIIRNCKFYPTGTSRTIIGGDNRGDHDFGYKCYLPQRIEIDGLSVCRSGKIYLFSKMNPNCNSSSYSAEYPMVMPQNITVKNFNGLFFSKLYVSNNKYMFSDVSIDFLA